MEGTVCHGGERGQESEVAGHMTLTDRKQRGMDTETQLAFSFSFKSQPLAPEDGAAHTEGESSLFIQEHLLTS